MDKTLFRSKIINCFLGKAAGGTLGAPYEGFAGPLNLSFYDPVPTEMLPNDDLDLQILTVCYLSKMKKPEINRNLFKDMWLKHVTFCFDEYGVALRNMASGINPSRSGSYDNFFVNGLGAAIRSELWAALAPGDPHLAAQYAYEDGCIDHVGDGLYAAQFLAALESECFVNNNIFEVIEAGVREIPQDCELAKAIRDTLNWCSESDDYLAIRKKIMQKYGSDNFTDVIMNIPFVILGLVLGGGDFGKSVCIAVNCGEDADCTGATLGAILGILGEIPSEWLDPIGDKCVLSPQIIDIEVPATLHELCDMILELRERLPEFTVPEEKVSTYEYKLSAKCGIFAPWCLADPGKFKVALPENYEERVFNGFYNSIPSEIVPANNLYLMEFTFELFVDKEVVIMFNTPAPSQVYLNGEFLFGRDGGRMTPSFHRCPINQYKKIKLAKGVYKLLAGVAANSDKSDIEWVLGIGNAADNLWLSEKECKFF
ncbi:MAG: ADP-ribosylglycohydrolase family protein [Lentisphaeria bacterium]|nr:ADP-ribosylglycohydrolase family protein [Lentisphaeria bacterium]